jgi:NAD+ kinase
MIIALIANTRKKENQTISKQVAEFLKSRNVTLAAEEEMAGFLEALPLSAIPPGQLDFILSLGGDGTILQIIHRYPQFDAPILPINLGGLGFMAEIKRDEIVPHLQLLLDGHYWIQERMMMECLSAQQMRNCVVNEVTLHRASNPSLIDLAIYLDGNYLNTFSADGIILSTPTGSTAYSLAAGGPILTPELTAFILTPICPHTISNRPIVFLPKKEVRIEYKNSRVPAEVCIDGFHTYPISKGEPLTLTYSDKRFKLVCMQDHDFFSTLRSKLGWSGQLRSSAENP